MYQRVLCNLTFVLCFIYSILATLSRFLIRVQFSANLLIEGELGVMQSTLYLDWKIVGEIFISGLGCFCFWVDGQRLLRPDAG